MKIKIEIWSDVVCPFCYIGKRRFEKALEQFEHQDKVEVEWKSFELNPEIKTNVNTSIYQYLSESKGWSEEQTRQSTAYVTQMAKEEGLDYNFDKVVVANSRDAHRLAHFAKQHGKQIEAEEALFKAYFIEGKNIASHQVLFDIGKRLELDKAALDEMLAENLFLNDVLKDEAEAQQLHIRGVPFFVVNRKYGVSGAQSSETFLEVLQKAYVESVTA